MSLKEQQQKIARNMKNWQKIEKSGMASTGKIMEKSENPLVNLIMEIIQRDSQMHFHVQEFIRSSLEKEAVSFSPEELADVWGMIEDHIKLEKSTIDIAKESLEATNKAKGMLLQHYLIEYMLKDEEKHETLLDNLRKIKGGMYPYG